VRIDSSSTTEDVNLLEIDSVSTKAFSIVLLSTGSLQLSERSVNGAERSTDFSGFSRGSFTHLALEVDFKGAGSFTLTVGTVSKKLSFAQVAPDASGFASVFFGIGARGVTGSGTSKLHFDDALCDVLP
jgi:hypothetical protein